MIMSLLPDICKCQVEDMGPGFKFLAGNGGCMQGNCGLEGHTTGNIA